MGSHDALAPSESRHQWKVSKGIHVKTTIQKHVRSEPATGIEVIISIPLCSASLSSPDEEDAMSKVESKAQELETFLVGFGVFPNISDEPTGIPSVEAKRVLLFKDSLSALLKDWSSIKVATKSIMANSKAAVSFLMESPFRELLSSKDESWQWIHVIRSKSC